MANEVETEIVETTETEVVETGVLGEEKPVETEVVETTETDKEVVEEEKVSSFSAQDFSEYKDVLNMEKVEGMFNELDEEGAVPSEVLKKYIDEVGADYKNGIEAQKKVSESITKNPPKGVDITELNGWVHKQPKEVVDLARQLTLPSNGEASVRAGIELINMLRMQKGGVADPEIRITGLNRETFIERYENIQINKKGTARNEELRKLKNEAKTTGNKEMVDLAELLIK